MKDVFNYFEKVFKSYCDAHYKANKAVYDAGLILM